MSFALKLYYKNNHASRNLLGTSWRLESRKNPIINIISKWQENRKDAPVFLDIGCRDGILTQYLGLKDNITGIDIDPQALLNYKLNFPNAEVRLADCNENLPFEIEKFDLIFAGEIIEHLLNPTLFVSEVSRILKPDGLFIGSTPNAFRWDKRLNLLLGKDPKTFSDPTHTQYFSKDSLRSILKSRFNDVEIHSHSTTQLANIFSTLTSSGFIWQAKK